MFQQLGQKGSTSAFGGRVEAVDFQIGLDESPDQPGPDGSLMIGRISLSLGAGALSLIARIRRAECSQAIGCEQFSFDKKAITPGAYQQHFVEAGIQNLITGFQDLLKDAVTTPGCYPYCGKNKASKKS